jgi:hypothetical protein
MLAAARWVLSQTKYRLIGALAQYPDYQLLVVGGWLLRGGSWGSGGGGGLGLGLGAAAVCELGWCSPHGRSPPTNRLACPPFPSQATPWAAARRRC